MFQLSVMKLFPEKNRSIYLKWLLIGLLIRLAFMPFTLHGDMADMNRVAYLLLYQGYIPGNQMAYPPLAYYTMSFFQFIFRPMMRFFGSAPHPGVSWITSPHVFRYSFLLKSYYLFFDLGIAFLLLRLLNEEKQKLMVLKFWMLNPLVIFTCYIQGQFDILPAFFIVLSLYYVLKSRLTLSMLCLGIGACFKNFPFFFLIPALILLGKTRLAKLKFFVLAVVPYLFLIYPYLGAAGFKNAAVTSAQNQRIFDFYFNLGSFDKVYVFIVGYTVILVLAYFHNYGKNSKDTFQALWRINLIIYLWLFATVYFHPQWFIWGMPLLILFVVKNKKLIPLYWVQIICIFVYMIHWGRQLLWWPFALVYPALGQQIRPPSEIIGQFYPPHEFSSVFRSIFTGILICMIYLVYRDFRQRKDYERTREERGKLW